jgi:hypothetical protein
LAGNNASVRAFVWACSCRTRHSGLHADRPNINVRPPQPNSPHSLTPAPTYSLPRFLHPSAARVPCATPMRGSLAGGSALPHPSGLLPQPDGPFPHLDTRCGRGGRLAAVYKPLPSTVVAVLVATIGDGQASESAACVGRKRGSSVRTDAASRSGMGARRRRLRTSRLGAGAQDVVTWARWGALSCYAGATDVILFRFT